MPQHPFVCRRPHGQGAHAYYEFGITRLVDVPEREQPFQGIVFRRDEAVQAGGGVILGSHGPLFFQSAREPSKAACRAARSNFFISRKARVTRATCSRLPLVIISSMMAGTTCHDTPNRSFNHPHCSASGTDERFPQ